MATKPTSSKSTGGKFPMGGKNKDVPRQHADLQTPGETSGTKSKALGKFAKGGTGKMAGKGSAIPRLPGRTARDSQ